MEIQNEYTYLIKYVSKIFALLLDDYLLLSMNLNVRRLCLVSPHIRHYQSIKNEVIAEKLI